MSHSFIRREIEGLEAAGHEVRRFSMRAAQSGLKDEADLRELRLTEAALGSGIVALIWSAIILTLTRPLKTFGAVNAARRLSGTGIKRKARHVAYWLEAAWLVRRLDRYQVQHLHAHFGTNPAAVAAIANAWGGPPFSFTVHGPDEFDAPAELALSEKVERAAFVVAISNFGRAQLMRWIDPAHWDKIKVVRCGVDQSFLSAKPVPIAADSTDFVCVARLSAQKGLPLLIEGCDALRREGRRFTLTIVGDGELREQIEREIAKRGLESVIKLLGSRSAAGIRDTLRAARAFVLPSFAEGLPVVLMEALGLARPVITTAIAGIPELVNNECGWVIPAGSEAALVNAMKAVLDSPLQQLDAMANVGRERVLEMHDSRRNAQLLANWLKASDVAICTR